MSITVLNIMEQVGSREEARILQFINDGLSAIADLTPSDATRSTIDIVANTRFYSLPSTMKKLNGVYELVDSDNSIYQKIDLIENVNLIQDSSVDSVTDDDQIIII